MGDEADDILRSLGLSVEDSKKYGPVKEKFEAHFVKRRNTIFERTKFNMRKQDSEPVDAFVTELYALAEHCGYGALHDEPIRDRLVVRLCDVKLSGRLQLDAELMLDRAVTQARQSETVKRQQSVLRAGLLKPDTTIGSVQRRTPPPQTHRVNKGQNKVTTSGAAQGHAIDVASLPVFTGNSALPWRPRAENAGRGDTTRRCADPQRKSEKCATTTRQVTRVRLF